MMLIHELLEYTACDYIRIFTLEGHELALGFPVFLRIPVQDLMKNLTQFSN